MEKSPYSGSSTVQARAVYRMEAVSTWCNTTVHIQLVTSTDEMLTKLHRRDGTVKGDSKGEGDGGCQ